MKRFFDSLNGKNFLVKRKAYYVNNHLKITSSLIHLYFSLSPHPDLRYAQVVPLPKWERGKYPAPKRSRIWELVLGRYTLNSLRNTFYAIRSHFKKLSLITLLLLIGCTVSAPPTNATSTPVASTQTQNTRETEIIEGIVRPREESRLAFLVPGTVIEISAQEGDFVQKGTPLLVIHNPDLDKAVMEASAELRVLEAEYEYWKRPRDKPPERRWLAESLVTAQKANLQSALAEADEKVLHAPFSGTLIENTATLGAYLAPHQKVILLADLSTLIVESTNLSEREIARLKIGQTALVSIPAINAEIPAEIIALAPRATPENNDIFYTVTLKLKETPADLRWGMSAEIVFDEN